MLSKKESNRHSHLSKEEAKKEIAKLVQTFKAHIRQYKSRTYKEAQVRKEFIDKFFLVLGWDVNNEQGYSEEFKEVINEDSIKIGESTKAPDYAFRIGGQRIFFVEAKKPSVNLKVNSESAFQLKNYAWKLNIPISILTDFEELAVYDCRARPHKKDKPDVARILLFRYENYLEQFDDIWSIFSKEAVLKGNFEKYVGSIKKKRIDLNTRDPLKEYKSDITQKINRITDLTRSLDKVMGNRILFVIAIIFLGVSGFLLVKEEIIIALLVLGILGIFLVLTLVRGMKEKHKLLSEANRLYQYAIKLGVSFEA